MIYTINMTRSLLVWKIQQATKNNKDHITYYKNKIPIQLAQEILTNTNQFDNTEGFTSTSIFTIDLQFNPENNNQAKP